MMYTVMDEEFVVGEGKGKYRNGLMALTAAIKSATVYAQSGPVDVLKHDETGIHVAYKVDQQSVTTEREGHVDIPAEYRELYAPRKDK